MNDDIKKALQDDMTIDIVTTGAKTGLQRRTEIWFMNINGRIFICGTPGAKGESGNYKHRDWLANMKANPQFTFCLKESINAELPARAEEVTDMDVRRMVMTAPETQWYRGQVDSVEELVEHSPIVEIFFEE